MRLPEKWSGDPNADPNEILGVVMKEAATFSSRLGIFYPVDILLNRSSSIRGTDLSGRRVPDVPLQKPGTLEVIRLHKVTPNIGVFYIIVFGGEAHQTKTAVQRFADGISNSRLVDRPWLRYLIISKTIGASVYELLDMDASFARVLYDASGEAHKAFLVGLTEGTVYVLRPDGWIGTTLKLSGSGVVEELERYFDRFMHL
jgi:phenol 2-monooxygenase